jgi:hypothetical protein
MDGFLLNDIYVGINRDNFLCHHNSLYFENNSKFPGKAYETNLGFKTKSIKSTIGEFLEREVLTNQTHTNQELLVATSLINGSTKTIKSSKVLAGKEFVDSCGMASHYDSQELVERAYLEYFERQCLIFNLLSQTSRVRLNIYHNFKNSQRDEYIKQFVEDTYYYNISLNTNLFVILAIALDEKNNKKAVGLGTNFDFNRAVSKSQGEILQNFSASLTKHNHEQIGILNKNTYEKDLYFENFHSLKISQIKSHYSHLLDKKMSFEPPKCPKISFKQLVYQNYKLFCMHPYILIFSSKREIPHLKICKILDFNWFPHMRPGIYDENIYQFVEEKMKVKMEMKVKLRRDIDIIPFP